MRPIKASKNVEKKQETLNGKEDIRREGSGTLERKKANSWSSSPPEESVSISLKIAVNNSISGPERPSRYFTGQERG